MEITNLLFFSLFIFFNIPIAYSSTAFSPEDNYLINCGSSTNSLINNRIFHGDDNSNFVSPTTISLQNENPSQKSFPLSTTARIFTKQSTYQFEIKKKGTHLVRFHFTPFNTSKFDLRDALFHVSVNGFLLLRDFSGKVPILKEYMVWVENGKVEVVFTPSKEGKIGFVNAIEVFSAPNDLIADTAKFVDSEGNRTIEGLRYQGLETVYRLNVGGPKVTPFNDTLWRTWSPDDGFLKSSVEESKVVHFGGRIKYQEGGLSREVGPDNVYSSARVMTSSPSFNMTWVLPVSVGYKYLVRLHFCDIASKALYELYFNVYVNGNLAYENLDLSGITLMLASPYYADFVVDADNEGVISVSISPSSFSSPERVNAILNGLEVMKMNNSMGSLDGEISVGSILKNQKSGNSVVLVPTVGILSLLLAALAVVYRRRTMAQGSAGWSPLPLDASKGNLKYDTHPLSHKFLFF